MSGQLTVPNTFINGTSIGGRDNTIALLKQGSLVKILDQAGVHHNM